MTMTLIIDLNAPTNLPSELLKKLNSSKCKALTEKLRIKYRFVRLASLNDSQLQEKKWVNDVLYSRRNNWRN